MHKHVLVNSHRKLLAWQACRELIREVYSVTRGFPADERFGLTAQLRRAAVAAAANIAEGYACTGLKETAHGVSIAVGSLAEVDAQPWLAAPTAQADPSLAFSIPRSPDPLKHESPPCTDAERAFEGEAGGGLLSHRRPAAVPSTLVGLTSVFGMGTGVTPPR